MTTAIEIDGRCVAITHPDRVLFPQVGWTKRDVVAYVRAIAPWILPHLARRLVTLGRFPEGVEAGGWFQTNCPPGAPAWVERHAFTSPAGKALEMVLLPDAAHLVWAANLGTIELHPFLATIDDPGHPHALVLDLDPMAPATVLDCVRVARELRARLEAMGLRAFPKTSGVKGLHLYVPVRGATYAETKSLARALARELTSADPERVTDRMAKAQRAGKVLIDWSQNDAMKSTVAPYSLRATAIPLVSAPLTWDELEAARSPAALQLVPRDVLARLDAHGDLFAPVLQLEQRLPPIVSAGP